MRKVYKKINYKDRQKIEQMVVQGVKPKEIAEVIGVHISTIYKELKRGMDMDGYYKAELAQEALFL